MVHVDTVPTAPNLVLCRIWLYGIKARRRRRRAVRLRLASSRTARRTGLPLRSRPDAGRAAAPRSRDSATDDSAHEPRDQLGDEHQAVTIADAAGLVELVTAIDAR